MTSPPAQQGSPAVVAMICAAAVNAQFIAGKATRDALYLAHLDVTSLPSMVIATSALSILLVAIGSKTMARVSPGTFVPGAFALNAALLGVEWLLISTAPEIAARAVYLQISGLGPILGSGFWLIATDRFDPHTARQRFGQIAGVGTLSGLASALVAERAGALAGIEAMLPVLAVLNLVCAWQVRRLALSAQPRRAPHGGEQVSELMAERPASGLKVLAQTPYLRNLAALVLLGTISATLMDYVFKVQAVEVFGRGDNLLRFFAIYYAATNLLAFAVQTGLGPASLDRLGLGLASSTPSAALLAGSAGALIAPGLQGVLLARGAESVFRGSLFRTAYEIFYTPVPSSEKRAAKSIIDVGFDRFGDAIGGGLIPILLLLPASRQYAAILMAAGLFSVVAIGIARRLNRGYIATLERSLLNHALEFDLADVQDTTTRTVMLRTLRQRQPQAAGGDPVAPQEPAAFADPEIQEIVALRSHDRERVVAVLRDPERLPATLVPHVIPLLAWDPVAEDAVRALRKSADAHVGELLDALLDHNQPFAVRRRLARVFSVCVSQRAVDGVLLGLEDQRFEVRFQCGRSLAAMLERSPGARVDRERVFDVVRREVVVSRPVWESQRLLDRLDGDEHAFVDEFLKDRAGQSLAHVFTLLSLVLPMTPLQIAFRGLHTDDPGLRGTALEYLEGVLPPDIRDRLWPFVDGGSAAKGAALRPRQDIVDDLLRSHESIQLNLEALRRRGGRSETRKAASGV